MTTEKMTIPKNACLLAAGKGGTVSGKQIKIVASSGKGFPHWYYKNLVLDHSGLQVPKSRSPILMSHDKERVLGYFDKADVAVNGGLVVTGTLIDTDASKEFVNLVSQGMALEASLYGIPKKIEYVPDGEETEVNGRKFKGEGKVWRSWELREVSPTIFGFDRNTSADVFAFAQGENVTLDVEVLNRQEAEDEQLASQVFALSGGDDHSSGQADDNELEEARELLSTGECANLEEALSRVQEDNKLVREISSGKTTSAFIDAAGKDKPDDEYQRRLQSLIDEKSITTQEAEELLSDQLADEIYRSSGIMPVEHRA